MARSPIAPRTVLALALGLASLLAGCVPAAREDARPVAAVIGAPVDAGAPGAAAALDRALRQATTGHDLASAARMRFLEVRSGLVGSRVEPGSARIARTSGADVAVVVRPATLTREVLQPDRSPSERLVLQLDVQLIAADDARELGRLAGPRVVAERGLPDGVLPPLDEDPLLAAAIERSVADLASRVAEQLRSLAVSGSSGG
jgi:hypothetical protein